MVLALRFPAVELASFAMGGRIVFHFPREEPCPLADALQNRDDAQALVGERVLDAGGISS